MGWSVGFVVVLGVAALVPAGWAVLGVIRGKVGLWPAALGVGWAAGLMLVTFVGMATDWGGCDAETDEGVLRCATCDPDVWASACGRSSEGCPAIPAGEYCPAGERPTFAFCEPFQSGAVKQPAATWSDLAFVASGLWILWWLHLFGASRDGSLGSPMRHVGWLPIAYGMIVIFMGPPSMWFHASMKNWGGWFDSISVVVWLGFNALYVSYALAFAMWGRGRGAVRAISILVTLSGLVVVFGIVAWVSPGARLFGYIISGTVWGIAELAYVFVGAFAKGVRYRRTWWMFPVNFALLGVTMGIWALFNDGLVSAEACQSREGIPGHAFFHILASLSTAWTFADFASERSVERM